MGGRIAKECEIIKCAKIICSGTDKFCSVYISPEYWWNKGRCPVPRITEEQVKELKLNPLKASKRRWSGRLNLGYKIRRYTHGSHKRRDYVDNI